MNIAGLAEFLSGLNDNNNKAWMDENRGRYEELRGEFKDLVGEVILAIGGFDKSIGLQDPGRCMFRINRDIRFSKNKQPYKPHFSAFFVPGGKKTGRGGYYLRFNHLGQMWCGGGTYKPDSDQLWNMREEIAKNPEHIHSIIDKKSFTKRFDIYDTDKLRTAPQGYSKEHPEIELLRLKHFFGMEVYDLVALGKGGGNVDKEWILKTVMGTYREIFPLVEWVNEVAGEGKEKKRRK